MMKTDVMAFLDLVLMQEGGEWWVKYRRAVKKRDLKDKKLSEEDKKQLKALKKRLAAIGSELMLKLPELNASVSSKETPRPAKVRLLQLQVICRLLCYGTQKTEKKQLKKEIRGLLDRVALLLDAANPPSLADEDADERSPFQEFLQQALAPRLEILFPVLMQYLLRVYELEEEENVKDDTDKESTNAMMPRLLPVKVSQPPIDVSTADVIGKGSILSALHQERPTKRSCRDTTGLVKEVQLPHHLQQKQMQTRPRKSRRLSSNVKSSSSTRTSQNDLLRAAANTKPARSFTTPGIAAKQLARPGSHGANTSSASTSTAPSLQRTLSERPRHRDAVAGPTASKNQSPPLRRAATTSCVVMGTPDRPKRIAARTTRRVLVEASPPLRKPSGVAAVPRLLQRKSTRPGSNPPSLFR
ncbi:hypothetical protein PHPALM_31513 [Phytophthora palmivora]|uniref:Uncharacterized protein n=1 Tax=Phytophthora palmivora TaxID=4796 RepID=A0A2P4X2E0_9STRA|nr:hypothetical protein PHPALM_31513 [Phytophthora palmivora]